LVFTYKDRNKEHEQSARLEVGNYLIVLLKIANNYNFEITPSILHAIFFLLQNEDEIKLNLTFRPQFLGVESQELNETLKELVEKGVIKPVYKEFKDPITGDTITYISNYKVQKENVEIKVDPKIIKAIEKWVKMGKKGLLNYMYTKYEGIVGYKALREELDSLIKF